MGRKKLNRKRKGFSGKVRPCWCCATPIQFMPTRKAPRGAWVDANTQQHHHCKDWPYPQKNTREQKLREVTALEQRLALLKRELERSTDGE
jgi:hypothetical protein